MVQDTVNIGEPFTVLGLLVVTACEPEREPDPERVGPVPSALVNAPPPAVMVEDRTCGLEREPEPLGGAEL